MLVVASLKSSESPIWNIHCVGCFCFPRKRCLIVGKTRKKTLCVECNIAQNAKFYRISICSTCSDVEFSFGGVVVSESCDMAGKFKNWAGSNWAAELDANRVSQSWYKDAEYIQGFHNWILLGIGLTIVEVIGGLRGCCGCWTCCCCCCRLVK